MIAEIVHGKWIAPGLASTIAIGTVIWNQITPDSVVMVMGLGAAVIVGILGWMRTTQTERFKAWETRLALEEQSHDKTRQELSKCREKIDVEREALCEAARRIQRLEHYIEDHGISPMPVSGLSNNSA